MTAKTYFIVQPFERTKKGGLRPATASEARDAQHAKFMAEKALRSGAGAIAFAREVDEDAGDYGEPRILAVFGDVPEEALDAAA